MTKIRTRLLVFLLVLFAPTMTLADTSWSIWQGVVSDNTLHIMMPPGTVPNANNHGCGLLWVIDESGTGSTEVNTSGALRYGATTSLIRLTGLTFKLETDGSLTVQRTGAGNSNTYNVLVQIMCV